MEWLWHDPDSDEPTRWWTIDPDTGQPDGGAASERSDHHCLSESALHDARLVADAIATTFATKHFSDEDVSALIMNRVVPTSFRGDVEDAAELVEHVDDLWTLAEDTYVEALGRPPDQIERFWLFKCAIAALRAREGGFS